MGKTPLRGWSSWSSLEGNVDEGKIKAAADAMAQYLKPSGYLYVNIDAGWSHGHDRYDGYDRYGRVQPDPQKFPSGIKALADYVHSKGLKLGIYMQPGLSKMVWAADSPILGTSWTAKQISDGRTEGNTVGGRDGKPTGAWSIDFTKPGSDEYIQSVINELASWDVDYIKLDFVGPGGGNVKSDNREELKHWMAAIKKCGRPIWLELSNSLSIENIAVWKQYSNGWRIGNDIERYAPGGLTSWSKVMERFHTTPQWASFAGPGGWNDLDSVEIGNGEANGLTVEERKSCMTLWCMSCSPLILGTDLTHLDPADLEILTNPEVLAIQAGGRPAMPLSQATPQQIWRVKNADGSETVALFNLSDADARMTVTWSDLGIVGPAYARDLWNRRNLGKFPQEYSGVVPMHGVLLLNVSTKPPQGRA